MPERRIQRLTVFTGAAAGNRPEYAEAAAAFGTALAERGIGLVYGGGRVGLMGTVADAVLAAGGEAHGVIPRSLVEAELAHPGLTRLDVVADLHERKARMAELGDGFVALPGGIGTLEEFFEAWTWQQLGFHAKPVAVLDAAGFWEPLTSLVGRMVSEGFVAESLRERLVVEAEPADLLDALETWTPPAPKWAARASAS